MAEEKIVFKVVADYDKAIKEWQQLRDKVASTSKEYKECQIEINRLKVAKGELTGEVFKTKEALVVEKQALVQSNIEYKKREKELNKTFTTQAKSTQSVDKMTASNKQLGTQLKKTTNSTGGAATSVLELGRVVSDAPYGIRGMANNVSQLASNMLFGAQQIDKATGKAVGFGNVLKGMGKAFIGPLGILFAIQAVVAAVDFFFGAMTKAEKAIESFRVGASKSATDLKSLLTVLDENMLSNKELAVVVENVNSKYKDLNLSLDAEGRLTKESIIQIRNKIDALGDLALANAMMAQIEAQKGEVAKAASELQKETSEDLKKLGIEDIEAFRDLETQRTDETLIEFVKRKNLILSTQEGTYKGLVDVDRIGQFNSIKRQVASFDKTKKRVDKQTKELLKIATGEGFFDEFFKVKDGAGAGDLKLKKLIDPKEFEGDIFEVEDMLRKFAGKELLRSAKTAEDKRTAKNVIELEGYKHDFEEFRLNEDKKFVEYEKTLEKKRLAEIESAKGNKERIGEINLLFDETSVSAQEEFEADSTESYRAYVEGLKAIADKNKPDIIIGEVDPETEADRQKNLNEKKTEFFQSQVDKYVEYAKTVTSILGTIGDFVDSEFERELTMEQNKTNVINNELKGRLANENLSKDERQAIQDKIAQNDEKLRVKQEAIERKRFKVMKAIRIAMAIVDTSAAVLKAYASQLVIGDPTSIIRAQIAAGIAGALGAAQVAMIARQKFQSSASGVPQAAGGSNSSGSSSGGSDRAEPSFNIVGMSGSSQLLEAIQSQFDKPLQAYVVSREVTRQQNLDAAINTGASL